MTDSKLQHFIEDLTQGQPFRVQDDLGKGYVRLRAAEAQRRQAKQDIRCFEDVVIEMLRNARDAGAHAIFVATWTEGRTRHMTMLDDAQGIPAEMHETVFEPFVTSKLDSFHSDRWGVHGRGMALYSIRENTIDAHIVASKPGLGSVFSVSSDLDVLPEKKDQSTFPSLSTSDGGYTLRGPHNITRTVLEFAIDERDDVAVYLGSAADILSTLRSLGKSALAKLTASKLEEDIDALPFIMRFASADDASALARLAESYALPISWRTAHRIVKGEIVPLKPHLSLLSEKTDSPDNRDDRSAKGVSPHVFHSQQRIRFDQSDIALFSEAIKPAFAKLAKAYYLDSEVEPIVTRRRDHLVIRIPLIPDERNER